MSLPGTTSAPAAATSQTSMAPSSSVEQLVRARVESKLRASVESVHLPLSPSLPTLRNDEVLMAEASGAQASAFRSFFTEQDFSRFSHQSGMFRERVAPWQQYLQGVLVSAQEQRRKSAMAAAIMPVPPALVRSVTFLTPESPAPADPKAARIISSSSSSPSATAVSPIAAPPPLSSPTVSTPAAATPPTPRNDMEIAAQAAGVPVARPTRISSLSQEEHYAFLQYQQMIADSRAKGGPPLGPSELADFLQLQARVKIEQDEYRQYIMKELLANKEAYFVYHYDIQQQIERVLAGRRERVRSYPQMYDFADAVDIAAIKCAADDPVLQHQRTLLQLGRVLSIEAPSQATYIALNLPVFPVLSSSVSSSPANSSRSTSSASKRWTKKEMPVVSGDVHMQRLVKAHGVDVALSSSALVALVDNHAPSFAEPWILPVRILASSDTNSESGVAQHKCAYVDKPLVRQKMTPREKTELYYKVAFESLALQTESGKGQQLNKASISDFIATEALPAESALALQEDNLTYNLWKFDDIKVLVRCKIHGVMDNPTTPTTSVANASPQAAATPPAKQPPYRYFSLKAKLEYQPKLGWEEVTLGETARWWTQTFIRPDAHLLLARVNPFDSKLLHVERKDMIALLPPTSLFKPVQPLKVILILLRKLRTLPPGNYLLTHKARDTNVVFYRAAEGEPKPNSPQYDLHADLATAGASDVTTVPVVQPRWAGPTSQIPYTFPVQISVFSRDQPSKQHTQAPSKYKRLRYCHAFAHASCRAGAQCKYPHLSEEELEAELVKQQGNGGAGGGGGVGGGGGGGAGPNAGNKKAKKGKKGTKNGSKSGEASDDPAPAAALLPPPVEQPPQQHVVYQSSFRFHDLDAGEDRQVRPTAGDDFATQLALHREKQRLQKQDGGDL